VTGSELVSHGAQVGLVVASAVVPTTFARSLSERTWKDQGLITGLATGSQFALTVAAQAVVADAGRAVSAVLPFPGSWSDERRERAATVLLDAALVPVGFAASALLAPHEHESLQRALARQVGWRLGATGLAGAALGVALAGTRSLDRRLGAEGRLARLPVGIPVGLAITAVNEAVRQQESPSDQEVDPATANPLLGVAAGGGVVLLLGGILAGESVLARELGSVGGRVLPGSERAWRRLAHVVTVAGVGLGTHALWNRAMARVEAGTTAFEAGVDDSTREQWTNAYVSGGPSSLVSWEGLGREGRRHVSTYVRPTPPQGVPDLLRDARAEERSIATVMQEAPRATPISVFVGLDNAPTPTARVDLALAEMDRTDAWSRSLLMLVSPTGTGYVNYVASASAQYMTRGDIATVTLQYSKRPSPLSLGKIGQAREQNRLLWLRILERLRDVAPDRRPRVVVFGESLGAHTSQSAFAGWGTLGPEALGIDRALWIGTPAGSPWYQELQDPTRIDVDRRRVAVVNDYEQLLALGEQARREIRYVLLSHDNDGVTKFSPELLSRRPAWLGPARPQPEEVAGRSPRGVPSSMRWRPVTTFFQLMVDMKNAQIPGEYRAWAHDYRPDLPEFVRDVFGLECSDEQLERIKEACQYREELRAKVFT
jgi:uncharacterized membrane protein